jgi:hypothetical protein
LRKVECSTLKECGEEKARRALHPKYRSKRKKLNFLPFLHFFFFSMVFFFFVFFFLLLEKKKMKRRRCLKQNGRNKKAETGAKSERAK